MKVAAKKTITYLMILVLAVTYISSTLCIDVYAEESTEDTKDNPYIGNPDNVFNLVKNSWDYLSTELGILWDDTVNYDLHNYPTHVWNDTSDFMNYLSGHNMTTDDVVANYNISDNTVTFNIEFVKNIYNDVVEDIQEEEGWYWSSGKNGYNLMAEHTVTNYQALKKQAGASNAYIIFPMAYYVSSSAYLLSDNEVYVYITSPYFYVSVKKNNLTKHSANNGLEAFYSGANTSSFIDIYTFDETGTTSESMIQFYSNQSYGTLSKSSNTSYTWQKFKYLVTKYNTQNIPYFGSGFKPDNCTKYFIGNFIFGPKQKVYTTQVAMQTAMNGSGITMISDIDLSEITVRLDDLNRDWIAINTEIKNMIDEYMQDFQDYTDKQDKIDAVTITILEDMNTAMAEGKEDIIGAIKESAAAQELWLERIYNKEVEIYTKYLEENEQTQAVLVGIAEMLKEYFDTSLANQGNLLTYEQFQEYAQQIIDAINNSSSGTGESSGDVTIDLSIVDEFIQKIYEKETSLYEQIQEINNKLDTINDKITLYLYNTEKSIPFLKDISNILEDGFKSVTDAISDIKVSITNNIVDITNRTATDDEDENASILDLVNCVLYAVLILGGLVDLFLKLLEYVILMFQIPAQPWLFNSYILQGWDYAESIKIPNTDFGIIQFLRLLIYIILIFGVVKIVKRAIDSGTIDAIGK